MSARRYSSFAEEETAIVFFRGNGASKYQIDCYDGLFRDRPNVYTHLPPDDLDEVEYDFGYNPVYWVLAFLTYCKYVLWDRIAVPGRLHAVKFWNINLAQDIDIAEQRKRHNQVPTATNVVSFGFSRGALTTFLAFALRRPTPVNVQLVLLEGTPSSIDDAIVHRFGRRLAPIVRFLLSTFTKYDVEMGKAYSAVYLAEKFPKHIPVAFVTSKNDRTVPATQTRQIYQALINAGHQKCHMLELEDAGHDTYWQGGSSADRLAHSRFVNEMFKLYVVK